jgi:pheromone shutdown-related protein TraB
VGTAHISQESADLVQQVIGSETPDCVCVELDQQRYLALSQQRRWEDLDLKEVIRRRQLSPLIVGLVLSAYQKKLGGQLGVMPGTELLEAAKVAQQHGIPIALCDRDVRVTLGRAWRSTPFFKKLMLAYALLMNMFDTSTVSENSLRELRQQDVLSAMLQELGDALPTLRQALIDERDIFLAQKIREAKGDRIVAVVGAAHVNGIRRLLSERRDSNLENLNTVPPVKPVWKWLRWGIPAVIGTALVFIGWQKGAAVAGHNALFWILANGIPSACGAIAAFAHPLTIITAFLAAPVTSLTPVIGAGYVTALVQAYIQPPTIREFQSVADDIHSVRKWWQNKLLRIFLAFLLPGLGSMIGTWIGGYEILSNLF